MSVENNVIQLNQCTSCMKLTKKIQVVEDKKLCTTCLQDFLNALKPIEYYLYLELLQNQSQS